MNADKIINIIIDELTLVPDIRNVSGIDLTKCLIEPVNQKYINSNDSTDIYGMWTVFQENEDKSGYKIYFDEETKMFGFAISSDKDELIDIRGYGTFLKTIYSM